VSLFPGAVDTTDKSIVRFTTIDDRIKHEGVVAADCRPVAREVDGTNDRANSYYRRAKTIYQPT